MKKGQIVKCVRYKPCDDDAYLTDGEYYEVINAHDNYFEVIADDGGVCWNASLDSSHAVWELVSE